jgi:uncharacterized repeat protein (TIGR03803 family)
LFCRVTISRSVRLTCFFVLLAVCGQLARAQTETVIYSFIGGSSGDYPESGLLLDTQMNLYGTADGGDNLAGVIYKLTPGGAEKVLLTMTGTIGNGPFGTLIHGSHGELYGTAFEGGSFGQGTVFELTTSGTALVLYNFTGGPDGDQPQAGVVRDQQGNLYGTTPYGGLGTGKHGYTFGVVYEITASGKQLVLYRFKGGADGYLPWSGVIRDPEGNLYGPCQGGAYNEGAIFEVNAKGEKTLLYSFTGASDGYEPISSSLLRDAAGNLYGTAGGGGDYDGGTVYKLTPSGQLSVLHAFAGGTDGRSPTGTLVLDGEGNLYGVTILGGTYNCGTVYKVTPDGTETVLYTFTCGSDGAFPVNGLVSDSQGNLYGAAPYGGAYNLGAVFKVVP